jgi:hypothetical protein
MGIARRSLFAAAWLPVTRLFAGRASAAPEVGAPLGADETNGVREAAKAFVEQESPSDVWPFTRAAPGASSGHSGKVLIHYFLPLPLSIDNKAYDKDYYTTQYLRPEGENNKFFKVGGYLRERPRPAGPWPQPFWKLINFGIDVLRAREIGADGFGVDLLSIGKGNYWGDALNLYNAGQAVAPDFGMVPEPDIPATWDIPTADVQQALSVLARHPSAFRLADGRALVAPFAPERKPVAFWADILGGLTAQGIRTAFLPILLDVRPNAPKFAPISYGMSEWGQRDVSDATADTSAAFWRGTAGADAVWMAAVAPQDERPKSSIFWEAGNTSLYRSLWERAIAERVPYVQIITWNDYGENTQISPSSRTNFLFYDLSAYYISWYKSGRRPRILRDAIYYCHRLEMLDQQASVPVGETPLKLMGRDPIRNDVELIALLTAPAKLEIQIDGQTWWANADAGMAILTAPLRLGRPVFRVIRNGQTVVERQSDWEIRQKLDWEDALYVGGSSTRPKGS